MIDESAPAPDAQSAPPPLPKTAKKQPAKKPKNDELAALKAQLREAKNQISAMADERDEAVAENEVAGERIDKLERSATSSVGNTMHGLPLKGKKKGKKKGDEIDEVNAKARRLDRSKPFGEISPPWNNAHFSQNQRNGSFYFDASGMEITTLRQAGQEIIDPGLAEAQARMRAEAINLAAWAEGVEDYADVDVFRALRDRFFISVSSIHDAVDVLIEKQVVKADKQKRSRVQAE